MSEQAQPIPVTSDEQRGRLPQRPDPAPQPLAPWSESSNRPLRRSPLTDIYDGEGGLVLEADLPGASERTLTIHLEHNVLTLRALVEPSVPPEARLIQQEYPGGDFERAFILSDDLDRSRITAELKNGVLRIWLPRMERVHARVIAVRSPDDPH
jgi:HSP20 family molecular chaperone IbpA